jgi:hypothetical protein
MQIFKNLHIAVVIKVEVQNTIQGWGGGADGNALTNFKKME